MTKEAIVQFNNLSFQYRSQKQPTLHNINLTIYRGEKILIVGPSGSGKSTLGHLMNGLIPFTYPGKIEGSLIINGKETANESISSLSKEVGTVLQDPDGQFVGLTVGEDIAFALENDMVDQEPMKKKVEEVARLVDIWESINQPPHALSGGQKQRVSLAGVLVDDVQVLLFDEPLANLDPHIGKSAIEFIDDLKKTTDKTVVIIEHRLEDVLYRQVDRIILVNEGRIVADAPPDELLSTDILKQAGIREPLYITALKYAGVEITPDLHPRHINDLKIEQCAERLEKWQQSLPVQSKDLVSTNILEVRNVSFGYHPSKEIIHDVSFSVKEGEVLSIVGKNGAGKSTLSKIICGFVRLDQGTIICNGKDISKDTIKERSSSIGMVMQNPNQMISKQMIFEEVALGLVNQGVPQDEITQRVDRVLKICGLHPFRNWPISALSFGQKKRVTIAAILVLDPPIIILDEPTAGQDYRHYNEIMEFLMKLNREQGITIIMITHDMHLMQEYTDRAIVVSEGQVIAQDTPANILTEAKIIEAANLKETSLFTLAKQAGLKEPKAFVQCFIDSDRRERRL